MNRQDMFKFPVIIMLKTA